MTRNTNKKNLIRARMALTGENYLTASKAVLHANRPKLVTPWPELTSALNGGFRQGGYYAFCSRPDGGKMMTVEALVAYYTLQGKKVVYWNLQGGPGWMERVRTHAEGSLALSPIENPKTRSMALLGLIGNNVLSYSSGEWERDFLTSLLKGLGKDTDVFVIDFFQLLSQFRDSTVTHHENLARISLALKKVGHELGVTILMAVQTARNFGPEDEQVSLKGVGSLEEDVDAKILSSLDDKELTLRVIKNREGEVGMKFSRPRKALLGGPVLAEEAH